MPDKTFDVFHSDWREWISMLEWHLQYSEPLTVESVMSALVTVGFTITPPARKRYRVECNGRPIYETDQRGNIADSLGPAYSVVDTRQEGKDE